MLVSNDGPTQTANLFGLTLFYQDDGTTVRTLLADGLGSVRIEMVGSAIDSATTYEPYGKLLARSGTSGTVYGYTGEQHDGATGLVYLRARYYSPDLKIFMSVDPFPGYLGLPASQHPYSYVHNNAVNLTDPTGEVAWFVPIIAAGALYGVGYLAYDYYFPQGTEPQDSNLAWWIGQALGYKNVQEDIAVMHDPCACPLRKGIAGIGAVTNAVMGISTVHGVGVAAKSAPQMARAFSSPDPIQALQTFARSRGATYHPTSYVDDAGRIYPNYRPLNTSDVYVDPTGKNRLNLVTSFRHELTHVQQGTGLGHRISAASTNAPDWLKPVTLPFGYFLNPVEVNAAASAFGLGGNNFAILAANRGLLDISNAIKYGSERGNILANAISSQYNQGLDYLCKQMGYE